MAKAALSRARRDRAVDGGNGLGRTPTTLIARTRADFNLCLTGMSYSRQAGVRACRLRVDGMRILCLALAASLTACAVGPDYQRPSLPQGADAPAFKERGDWKPATPAGVDAAQAWWTGFGDVRLDALVEEADRANQDIRVAEAQYREAQALVQNAQSALFPALNGAASASRSQSQTAAGPSLGNSHAWSLQASWEPDLWGSVAPRRRGRRRRRRAGQRRRPGRGAPERSRRTLAQRLPAAAHRRPAAATCTRRTVDGLREGAASSRGRSTAPAWRAQSDVASWPKASSRAGAGRRRSTSRPRARQAGARDRGADRPRAGAVHAGRAPAGSRSRCRLPPCRPACRRRLLEHRPRHRRRRTPRRRGRQRQHRRRPGRVLPALTLSAAAASAGRAGQLLFDARPRLGAGRRAGGDDLRRRSARSQRGAGRAAYDVAAAQYQETVLGGFQQVEDELAALQACSPRNAACRKARGFGAQRRTLTLTQYRAGTRRYLAVVTAQALSLTNQRTAMQLRGRLLAASVALIKATGGGWSTSQMQDSAGASPAASAPRGLDTQMNKMDTSASPPRPRRRWWIAGAIALIASGLHHGRMAQSVVAGPCAHRRAAFGPRDYRPRGARNHPDRTNRRGHGHDRCIGHRAPAHRRPARQRGIQGRAGRQGRPGARSHRSPHLAGAT